RHAQAQVRDVPLEVHPGGSATGDDHADEARPDCLAERKTEPERQEGDDEDAAAQPEERSDDSSGDATGDEGEADHRGQPAATRRSVSGRSALWPQVLRRVRQEGDVSGALEGNRKLALVT